MDSHTPIEEFKLYYRRLPQGHDIDNSIDQQQPLQHHTSQSHRNYGNLMHWSRNDWRDVVLPSVPPSHHYTQGMSYMIRVLDPDQQYEARVQARYVPTLSPPALYQLTQPILELIWYRIIFSRHRHCMHIKNASNPVRWMVDTFNLNWFLLNLFSIASLSSSEIAMAGVICPKASLLAHRWMVSKVAGSSLHAFTFAFVLFNHWFVTCAITVFIDVV